MVNKSGILARRVNVMMLILPRRLASKGATRVSSAVMAFAPPSIRPKSEGEAFRCCTKKILKWGINGPAPTLEKMKRTIKKKKGVRRRMFTGLNESDREGP